MGADEVQVPTTDDHDRFRQLVKLAVGRAVGPGQRVFSNLNYYPADGAFPLAPDATVVPRADLPRRGMRSLRHADLAGTPPVAVIEIPSDSDSVPSFDAKLRRYQRLGIVVYVLQLGPDFPLATRLAPNDLVARSWLDTPCPELGGIEFTVDDGELAVRTHEGIVVRSSDELIAHYEHLAEAARAEAEAARGGEAEAARGEAEAARADAEVQRARAERLAARLAELGIDPD